MIISPFKRKILRITAYVFGSLALLLVAFHFWFINHAEQLLEDLVESQSNGKLKLQVKKFKFNWFSYDMQLRNAVFYSTDTAANTSYRFSVERIYIRVKKILPLIFEKKILVDSLRLVNPDVEVTRLRSKITDTTRDKHVSLPLEMGRVYNSIRDALEVLNVNGFQIDNGKFTLINKIQPDELPVTITHIDLHLDNLRVDTSNTTGKQKILFSDNVTLRTHNQDIFFPDGRHRLSFSNFRINILKKIVEFDSCSIAASKSDSAKSSFRVFFDKLRLTNIDFDTLYQKEVIKADSVYCINPQFKLDVELGERKGKRKPPPRLDELIQQLTGDLQLAFVAVNNGSFNINVVREGRPSSFTSDHNNFEMRGLRIEKKSPHTLTVKSFAMAIRNYENFLRDSTYSMQFDSILLVNNSVYLSNFSVKQMQNNTIINSFTMPQFELRGLSWDELVFERRLNAERATLYHPVINYSFLENNKQKNKKQDIFQTLAGIGDIIQLRYLDIADGQINLHFKDGSQLQLENADMSVLSQNLVQSNRIANLQRSVSNLKFKKGLLRLGNLTARMENADFTGRNGQLTAGKVYITNKEKNLTVNAKKVVVGSMMIDNNSFITEINGIRWQEADVQITGLLSLKKNISPVFIVKNIRGGNTTLIHSSGDQKLTAFFETILADEFIPRRNNKPQITNLEATGKNFSYTGINQRLSVDRFLFRDHDRSEMNNMSYTSNTVTDPASVVIPSVVFTPDLSSMINGSIVADNVSITHPLISLKHFSADNLAAGKAKKLPEVSIGKITVQQPDFSLDQPEHSGFTKIDWHSKEGKNDLLELTDFKITDQSAISAGKLVLSLHNFSFTAGGKTFDAGNGEINTTINNFYLKQAETGEWDWQASISDLKTKGFLLDSLGKHAGKLEITSARLNDLAISSATILNFRQLVKENRAFRLQEITGKYGDEINQVAWKNAAYDKSTKTFSLESFSFHPTLSKENYIASHKYQTDYVALQAEAIAAGPFDIDKYLSDTILSAGSVTIGNTTITAFRDKRLPFQAGIIKPLPVNLLRKIPVRLSIDTVNLNNANIEYAEQNEQTNQTGTIGINRMTAKIFPVRNFKPKRGDSLTINAQGYLMNAIKIQLQVKESFTDSLAGFLMRGAISPADASVLNSFLMPLASVKIESGILDTLSMQVVGAEYISMGEMKMFYHDLKIKFLANNTEKKKNLYKGFASFLANTFVVKDNNRSRTGDIFFERVRDKSTLNYLVKITLNGISSSIGIKNNKKLLREYKKELAKRNLPAREND